MNAQSMSVLVFAGFMEWKLAAIGLKLTGLFL
jgi:hypothetical protein